MSGSGGLKETMTRERQVAYAAHGLYRITVPGMAVAEYGRRSHGHPAELAVVRGQGRPRWSHLP